MKKFTKKMQSLLTHTYIHAQNVCHKLCDNQGTFVVEHGAAMLIVLVLAAIAIALLSALLKDTLAPIIKQKMLDFFN